jgi:uncharacterized Fe-S cluster protein YjdI
MVPVTREYTTLDGALTVEWRAPLCTHCKACWLGLPEVFNPDNRPWVEVNNAPPETIAAQVSQCPSGALAIKESL